MVEDALRLTKTVVSSVNVLLNLLESFVNDKILAQKVGRDRFRENVARVIVRKNLDSLIHVWQTM